MDSLNIIFQSANFPYALGWTLIHSLWQGSLVAILFSFILTFGLVKKARHKYIIAIIALLSIATFAAISFSHYFKLTNTNIRTTQNPILNIDPIFFEFDSWLNSLNILQQWVNPYVSIITIFWFVGFLFYSLKMLGALVILKKLKASAQPLLDSVILTKLNKLKIRGSYRNHISVLVSEQINSPLTLGFYKATIIFPLSYINQLSTEDTEAILAHELAHIIRKDYLLNVLLSLIKIIFYYHPAVWWISSIIDNEREKSTDDLAIKLCSKAHLDYAKTLINIQDLSLRNQTPVLAISFYKNKKQLLERIESILSIKKNRNQLIEKLTIMLLFLTMIGLFAFTSTGKGEKSKQLNHEEKITIDAHIIAHDTVRTTIELSLSNSKPITKESFINDSSITIKNTIIIYDKKEIEIDLTESTKNKSKTIVIDTIITIQKTPVFINSENIERELEISVEKLHTLKENEKEYFLNQGTIEYFSDSSIAYIHTTFDDNNKFKWRHKHMDKHEISMKNIQKLHKKHKHLIDSAQHLHSKNYKELERELKKIILIEENDNMKESFLSIGEDFIQMKILKNQELKEIKLPGQHIVRYKDFINDSTDHIKKYFMRADQKKMIYLNKRHPNYEKHHFLKPKTNLF